MTKIINQAEEKEAKVKKSKKKKQKDVEDKIQDSGSEPPVKKIKPMIQKSEATESEDRKVDPDNDSADGETEDRFPCQVPVKKTKKRNKKSVNKPVVPNQIEPKPDDRIKLALNYLKTWYKHREQWKFQKGRQSCLLNFMYDDTKISDKHFKRLLEYMSGMVGMARERTIKEAGEVLVKKMEIVGEDDEEEVKENDELNEKSDEKNSEEQEKIIKIKKQAERAKRILQKLS